MDEDSSVTVLADRRAAADQKVADEQARAEAVETQRLADEQAIAEAQAAEAAEAQRVADVQAQQQYVPPAPAPAAPVPVVPAPAPAPAAYYKNCTAARNAGAAPVYVGQPGYGSHLDRDGDGIGCE